MNLKQDPKYLSHTVLRMYPHMLRGYIRKYFDPWSIIYSFSLDASFAKIEYGRDSFIGDFKYINSKFHIRPFIYLTHLPGCGMNPRREEFTLKHGFYPYNWSLMWEEEVLVFANRIDIGNNFEYAYIGTQRLRRKPPPSFNLQYGDFIKDIYTIPDTPWNQLAVELFETVVQPHIPFSQQPAVPHNPSNRLLDIVEEYNESVCRLFKLNYAHVKDITRDWLSEWRSKTTHPYYPYKLWWE